jgi:hypothetical protein
MRFDRVYENIEISSNGYSISIPAGQFSAKEIKTPNAFLDKPLLPLMVTRVSFTVRNGYRVKLGVSSEV